MKPTSTTATVHIDSGVLTEYTMGVSTDVREAAYLLQTMTDLYSDKVMAFIRELCSNAWDSHVMAGNVLRPIRVLLPHIGVGNPKFVVQDWGVGLDEADMVDMYTYGKSSKRDSNEATGMLGLGAKSPLTFCLSFTIVGIKDGVKTIGVVTKNDMGVGQLKILDKITFTPEQLADPEIDTDNGVTISIPVPDDKVNEVHEKAATFFRFWRSGVLVDDEEPERIESALHLCWEGDLVVIGEIDRTRKYGHHSQDSYVVQGNVAYPYQTPDNLPPTIAWVPIGSVDFTPAREALHYTDLTNDTLAEIKKYIRGTLDGIIDYVLDVAPTTRDRLLAEMRLKQLLGRYRHPRINMYRVSIDAPGKSVFWQVEHGTATKQNSISEYMIKSDRHTFITGFPFKSVSPLHKQKCENAGISEPYLLIPDKMKFDLDGFACRRWDSIPDIPKEQKERLFNPAAQPRTETIYDFYVDGLRVGYAKYDGDLPVVWVENDKHLAQEISCKFPVAVATIICTQEDRFRRLHEGAKSFTDWVTAQMKIWERRLTKGDKKYLDSKEWERDLSTRFVDDWRRVKDTELRNHMNLACSEQLENLFWVQENAPRFLVLLSEDVREGLRRTRGYHYSNWQERQPFDHLVKRYPLLWQTYDRDHNDDVILYLNTKYRELQKTAKTATDGDTETDDDELAA